MKHNGYSKTHYQGVGGPGRPRIISSSESRTGHVVGDLAGPALETP